MPKIKNVFKWVNWVEKVIYWENKILFDYWDWTNSEWTVVPGSNQWTVTKYTDRATFYNGSADCSNYLSSDPIDWTKDFLFEVRANIPNTSVSYHGVYLLDIGNSSIGFNTNRESSYRNQIWCQLWNTSSSQRYAGESNSWTRDYFIRKEWNVLTMWRDGATKYTNNNYTFASTYYVNEWVYRDTLTIYTAKLTYL